MSPSPNFLFGISLTASFLAGVLALFAPCCITFLLPSYLGTIFREHKKVMYYTLVFALGLAFILVPISLGFRSAIIFLDSYHSQVYYFGALIMIVMSYLTLKPIFHLPQFFHTSAPTTQKINTASIFTLGLTSGLTSACCAPVLFAAITLTSLSPSLIQALFVSFAYVTGIVIPLFIISLSYEKLSSKIAGQNRQKIYQIFKYLGSAIFFITGILIAIFNYQGKIQINQMDTYSQTIRLIVFQFGKYFQNPIIDLISFSLIVVVSYRLITSKTTHE